MFYTILRSMLSLCRNDPQGPYTDETEETHEQSIMNTFVTFLTAF